MDGYVAVTFTKVYVRFGVFTRNDSSQTPRIEHVWVSTRFDTRAC